MKFASSALSETLLPADGLTVNCKYLLPVTALANVVPEKFVELNAFASGVGLIPAPRERVLVLRRTSVVVEAIVASLPAFPCGSQARITVSTNGAAGAAGSAIAAAFDVSTFDNALSGDTATVAVSKPKNSFTESIKPKPEFVEALAVTTSVKPTARLNIKVRTNVEGDELERFDIVIMLGPECGQAI